MANEAEQKQQAILRFWLSEIELEDWYVKNADFDAIMRARFLTDVEAALAGKLDNWANSDDGRLALILLLDQLTRNLFRDAPRALAGDDKALALSQAAVENGQLKREPDVFRRIFMLMPFMHSEALDVQTHALDLFDEYADDKSADYAKRHFDVIKEFGRFPHRNEILSRPSSDAELVYLARPDAGF